MAISAASSICRSLIRSAMRRMIAIRSSQGVWAQPGAAARAAAMASRTSLRVPFANLPDERAVDRRALLEGLRGGRATRR
jgi:hypothetical protein